MIQWSHLKEDVAMGLATLIGEGVLTFAISATTVFLLTASFLAAILSGALIAGPVFYVVRNYL